MRAPAEVDRLFDDVDIICAPATLDAAFDASVRYPTEQVARGTAQLHTE